MPAQMIWIRKEIFEKVQALENVSGLINELLIEHFKKQQRKPEEYSIKELELMKAELDFKETREKILNG